MRDLGPGISICWGILPPGDHGPGRGQVGIDLDPVPLIPFEIAIGLYGVHGTFGYAYCAIDAHLGIYHQEVWARMEAINQLRADSNTIGISATNTRFSNHMCHVCRPSSAGFPTPPGVIQSRKLTE